MRPHFVPRVAQFLSQESGTSSNKGSPEATKRRLSLKREGGAGTAASGAGAGGKSSSPPRVASDSFSSSQLQRQLRTAQAQAGSGDDDSDEGSGSDRRGSLSARGQFWCLVVPCALC